MAVTNADFLRLGTDKTNIVGGPVRILIAQRSAVAYPELISDVLNLNTYQPQANWFDLGHSTTPLESSSGFDTTEWETQQGGIVNAQVGNWNRSISVTLAETRNNKVMDVVHEATGRTTNSDGDEVSYFYDKDDVTEWRLAAINLDTSRNPGSNITMDIFPNVKRSGADSNTSWSRSDMQMHAVELRPYPDPGVPNDANWYRITQL